MKIKLDENLPHRVAILLKNLGHEAHTLHEERLAGRSDAELWSAVQKESRFFITQDLDFSDLRKFAPGSHHGILLLRLRMPSRSALIARIEQMFKNENVEEWVGCFIVATDRKIRLVKPERKQKP